MAMQSVAVTMGVNTSAERWTQGAPRSAVPPHAPALRPEPRLRLGLCHTSDKDMSPDSCSKASLFVGSDNQNYAVVFIKVYISGHQFFLSKGIFLDPEEN